VAASLPALGGGVRDIELVPWEIAQLRHAGDSALLAGAIAEQMRGRVRLSPQPVVPAPVRVLASANMPAVLVEIGFLSNPDEVQQLASDAYQASVAQAILDGILRFRELASQVPHGAATVPLLDPRRRP
jgi:N-acetylmuramoyl-L-alanine amidase